MPSGHTVSWRADIDGLRAIAVVAVVIYHALPSVLPGGFIGVDVFFVISGYLITGILLREHDLGRFSVARFYERRARRLFPALSVVLTATVLAASLFLPPAGITLTAKHSVSGAFSVANVVLWREAGYFDTAAHSKPLLNLWSLGVEEQFYLFWPLLLLLLWRAKGTLALALSVICLSSLIASELLNEVRRNAVFYLPFFRAWELGIGATLAVVVHHGWTSERLFPDTVANILILMGLSAIVISTLLLNARTPFPGISAVPSVIGTALVLWAGSRSMPLTSVPSRLLASPPFVYVGLTSYSLYLWHWPLLSIPTAAGIELGALGKLLSIGAAFLLSAATLRWIETPPRNSRHPRRAALLSVVALLVAALVSGLVYLIEVRARSEPERRQLEAALKWPKPDADRRTCPEDVRRMDPKLAYCRKSGNGNPSGVVWGDSHADHLFLGLAAVDSSRNWMLLGHMSCPPTVGIDVVADESACRARAEAGLQWIENQPEVKTVVVGFFGHYIDDTDVALAHRSGPVGPSKTRIDGEFAKEQKTIAFAKGLATSVTRLVEAGKRVILVLDVPELPFAPRDCFLRPRVDLREPHCSIGVGEVALRQAAMRAIVKDVADIHPEVRVVDPIAVVCGEQSCDAGTSEAPFFRDSHHLSFHGSALVAGLIIEADKVAAPHASRLAIQ